MDHLQSSTVGARSSSHEKASAVLAFLVIAAFVPGWHAPGLVLRWAVLLIGLPALVSVRATALHWFGFAFLAYAALSLIWTLFPLDGCYELGVFALLAGGFCLGSCLNDGGRGIHLVFLAAALGLAPSLVIGVMQWYGANPVLQLTPNPSGLFVNANLMGEASALTICGLIVTAKDWNGPPLKGCGMVALIFSSAALLLSHHRTSMIALAIAGMTWLIGNRRFALALMISAAAALAFLLDGLKTGHSLFERLAIWRATASGLTWLGHGAGSFRGLIPLYFLSESEGGLDYAHNDLLQLAFDYGIVAIVPAAIFAVLALRSTSPMRYVLIVFGIQSLAEFPLYMPATGFLAALAAGHCSRGWPRCGWRDVLGGTALFGRLSRTQSRQT